MQPVRARFIGVELYFDDLERAKNFYEETLGLAVSDEQTGHHARFDSGVRNATKVFDHGLQVGTSVGTTILTEYLKRHFGIQ